MEEGCTFEELAAVCLARRDLEGDDVTLYICVSSSIRYTERGSVQKELLDEPVPH